MARVLSRICAGTQFLFYEDVYRLYIYGGKRLFIISGNSDRESITSPIPMTIVRDEESHPFRGAAIKYR